MRKSIHTKRQERLRAVLKAERKKAGLTQDQLTQRLGAYNTFVSKYERGERQIDVVEFIAVAEALGIEPAQLFKSVLAD
ncbi:helix-turn-helix domain-containing protein [Microvirga sp. 2MCAF38]|uniref:helix-turn-helix domain-containing protein n=1 Tax=Microvirga sp. 2MCAF38 TaxID=3232989 RepID=UPI003F9C74D5